MPVSREIDDRTITLTDEERTLCENWTRVMGYFRPVRDFNPGKQSEHRERLYFTEHAVFKEKL